MLGAGITHRPAAAFGICSFPPAFDGFRVDPNGAVDRPCFLVSAHQDHFAPIEMSRGGAAALADAGMSVTYAEVDTGHVVSDAAAELAGRWLRAVLVDEPPTGFPDLLSGVSGRGGYYDGLWVFDA